MPVLYNTFQPLDWEAIDLDAAIRNTVGHLNAQSEGHALPQALTDETVGCSENAEQTVAIVGNGPSLVQTDTDGSPASCLSSKQDIRGNPMMIVAASGGYKFLMDRGVVPDAFVGHLPGNDLLSLLGEGREGVTYYIASMHAPQAEGSVFDVLISNNHDVRVFHAFLDVGDSEDWPITAEKDYAIGVGSGAQSTAMALYAAMGYRRFEIFGMGGGSGHAAEYDDNHCYPNGMTRDEYLKTLRDGQVAVKLDGKVYHLPGFVWAQAEEIISLKDMEPGLSVHFHGDPLFSAVFNTSNGVPRRDYEVIHPAQPGSALDPIPGGP